MRLKDWRENKGLVRESVAKLVGAGNASVVMRWENGTSVPSRNHMRAIYLASSGLVQPNDFYDLPDLKQMRAA